jgi:tetrahydromethanopterin S-methyltransferase subunit G
MDHKCTQKELIEKQFEHISEALERIEKQTTNMAVRVTELEAIANRQKGAMIAITAIYGLTIAIITIYLNAQGL